MIDVFLFGIVLGLIPITLFGLIIFNCYNTDVVTSWTFINIYFVA